MQRHEDAHGLSLKLLSSTQSLPTAPYHVAVGIKTLWGDRSPIPAFTGVRADGGSESTGVAEDTTMAGSLAPEWITPSQRVTQAQPHSTHT